MPGGAGGRRGGRNVPATIYRTIREYGHRRPADVDQAQVRADPERAMVSSHQPAAILSAATTRKKAAHP